MNKVKYGLKNVHYATITETAGAITYGTPVAIPGAISLTLDQEGEITPFYADNITYYQSAANNGYSGELEMALIPDSFRTDILNESVSTTNKIVAEYANQMPKPFALGFQIEGDESATLYWFYNVMPTRPSTSSSTVEDVVEPVTETMSITATPRSTDSLVRVKSGEDTDKAVKEAWFESVVEPS